jgi:hypothetical protein
MIAVQVRDEDVIDSLELESEPYQLILRSFSTINQEKTLRDIYKMT